ncbi:MAG: ABC transporter substrate-binding protein [Candidatus Rokubacteria bacterium]|nr:ABC transporter substrate-binding protein [Candidatus Rokubacteria bacterium]
MIERQAVLIVTLTVMLLALPVAAETEQAGKMYRIGFLGRESPTPEVAHLLDAFRGGLRELGYVEHQNVRIEWRWAEGRADRLPGLADELVRLAVDVIATQGVPETRAAKQATRNIPIVMVYVGDPLGSGLVGSLAHPDGNVTGLSFLFPELTLKQLEVLRDTVPRVTRVAVLWNPRNPSHRGVLDSLQRAAPSLGLALRPVTASAADEFDRVFAGIARERIGALIVVGDPLYFRHRGPLAALALRHRLPSAFNLREHVAAGGLVSYGVHFSDLYRRAAFYVVNVLQGRKVSDLPIEQPTRFELGINLKTAKALGLTIPPSVLLRADYLIE